MKQPFPHKWQYAMNLSNKSPEAVERINQMVKDHGGTIEHLSIEEIRKEAIERLGK